MNSANLRLAMWSGPRNISTAMMRSWGNRADTFVADEPFYPHYLQHTGFDHPGAAEVIAHHETEWRKVVAWLTGPTPDGKAIFFQKHMTHHVMPHMDTDWLDGMTHVFLIRDPREMLTSLIHQIPNPTLNDTGLVQQAALFDRVREQTGQTPPVVDARDVLEDPRGQMSLLCRRIGVPFDEAMLNWPPGRRETDGIWAKHWYHSVEQSTGFQPYRPKADELPDDLVDLHIECMKYYNRLAPHRLGA